jgi:hypothetical protein
MRALIYDQSRFFPTMSAAYASSHSLKSLEKDVIRALAPNQFEDPYMTATKIWSPIRSSSLPASYTTNPTAQGLQNTDSSCCWLIATLQCLARIEGIATYGHHTYHCPWFDQLAERKCTANPQLAYRTTPSLKAFLKAIEYNTGLKYFDKLDFIVAKLNDRRMLTGYMCLRIVGVLVQQQAASSSDAPTKETVAMFVYATTRLLVLTATKVEDSDKLVLRSDGREYLGIIFDCIVECMQILPCEDPCSRRIATFRLQYANVQLAFKANAQLIKPERPDSNVIMLQVSNHGQELPQVDLETFVNQLIFNYPESNLVRIYLDFPEVLCIALERSPFGSTDSSGQHLEYKPLIPVHYNASRFVLGPSHTGGYAEYRLVGRVKGKSSHMKEEARVSGERNKYQADLTLNTGHFTAEVRLSDTSWRFVDDDFVADLSNSILDANRDGEHLSEEALQASSAGIKSVIAEYKETNNPVKYEEQVDVTSHALIFARTK